MLSAICPKQWKPAFIREENTSPTCQTPSDVSICPLKSVTTMNCSQVETLMRTTSMQMSFPETVSDSLCRNSLGMQTDICSSCLGGWSQTILEVIMPDVEVLGWCGYMWSAVVRPFGCTAKLSESPLETAYGREMNIQFRVSSSGGDSCSQQANICGIVQCDKTEHFSVASSCMASILIGHVTLWACWDALDMTCICYVYDNVFQFLPISSSFAQPFKWSGPTFHRPRSTTWSTLCEGDVRQMVVTPPDPHRKAKLHISEWPFIVARLRHTCAIFMLSNQHLDMSHL